MAEPLVICEKIKQVRGGFIVELRYPYGDKVSGFGEVICTTWDQVIAVLTEAKLPD